MSLSKKIFVFVSIIGVVTIGITIFFTLLLQMISKKVIAESENVFLMNERVLKINSELSQAQSTIQKLLREKDIDKIDSLLMADTISHSKILNLLSHESITNTKIHGLYNTLRLSTEFIIDKLLHTEYATAQQHFLEDAMPKMISLINSLEVVQQENIEKSQQRIHWMKKNNDRGLVVLLVVILVIFVAILFSGNLLSQKISKPIRETTAVLKDIAEGEGDLTKRININRKDEIGQMSHWFNLFISKLNTIIKDIASRTESLANSSHELSNSAARIANNSESMTSQAHSVATTTEQMSTNIITMAASAEQMSVNATTVASSAEQMSVSMNAVSQAIEGFTVSIQEISKNSNQAKNVAKKATDMTLGAATTMDNLRTAAKEIGKVTEVIKRIAEQTNLLALNATIEAASAGDSGKGFAVVANEIKELANQSSQAADDIEHRISGVQNNASEAVSVIAQISEIISGIDHSIEIIAQSVQNQSSSSLQITSNVKQAASGIQEIAKAISEVSKGSIAVSKNAGEASKGAQDVAATITAVSSAASDSSLGANNVKGLSEELDTMSQELKKIVGAFKV